MNVTIQPAALSGSLRAIFSKSHAHRQLICAALSEKESVLPCPVFSQDIAATVRCLQALGAKIDTTDSSCKITPTKDAAGTAVLDCGESGSTYRFLVPVACALGADAAFLLSGKLPQRPMEPLWQALEAHGITVSEKGSNMPHVCGQLLPGQYTIAGNISSQFLSGLLFALPLLQGNSELIITGGLQSGGYLQMTLDALQDFSITVLPTETGFLIPGGQKYMPPEVLTPEGDWSNAAFWMCAAAARGNGITLTGLRHDTLQGDRAICSVLERFGAKISYLPDGVTVHPAPLRAITLDSADIPDLIPAIAVAACAAQGCTVIENIARLRIKESDRVATICAAIHALGGRAEATENAIKIYGKPLSGGTVDGCNDHRIVMLAAAASGLCAQPVKILDAQAVNKSYPHFFEDFTALGGVVGKGVDAQ